MGNTFQVETVSFTVGHLILLNLCMPHFCYSYFDKSWSTLAEGDEQSYQPKEKAQMVCLGFKPGAAGWQAQMKPQSYGGHQIFLTFLSMYFVKNFGMY